MLVRRILLYGLGVLLAGGLLYYGYCWTPPPNFEDLNGRLLASLREGDQAGVERALDEMREHHGEHLKLPLVEGYLAEIAGDWTKAQDCYRRALPRCATERQQADILLSIADLNRRIGDVEAAEKGLAEAVNLAGEGERSREFRVHLFIHKGKWSKALSEVSVLAEEHPESMRPLALRAMIARQRTTGQPAQPKSSND